MKKYFVLLMAAFMVMPIFAQKRNPKKKTPVKTVTAKPPKFQIVEDEMPEPVSADGKFKVVGNVFRNETNQKEFIVITAAGKNASELKSSLINILSSLFDHPDKVISTVGDNIVMVNAYDGTGFIEYGTSNGRSYYTSYTYSYSLKIEIKNGKIKVNSPSFYNLQPVLHYLGKEKPLSTYGETEFYESLKKANAELKVETIMNGYIKNIVDGLLKNDEW